MNNYKKQVRRLKIKLFLLITLPVFLITLIQTIWKEYSRIKGFIPPQSSQSAPRFPHVPASSEQKTE